MNLKSFVAVETNDAQEGLLDFLHEDIGNCAYLFLDIQAYGLEGPVIDVWVQPDGQGGPLAVAMRYSDSFQLYTRAGNEDEVDYDDLFTLIDEVGPLRISATKGIIDRLYDRGATDFDKSDGVIFELKKYRVMKQDDITVERASYEDIPGIVDLIISDSEVGKGYNRDKMVEQFEQRFNDNSGLSYVVRKDGDIVAHLGITAMSDDFLISGKTVVHPDHRDFPYGAFLDSYLINVALPELGKRGFAYMQEERRISFFERIGNTIVGEYGKLMKL